MKSFTDYLNEKMDPRDHAVERDGKFVVVDKDGETVKTFEDKAAAEKYAVANHDKLMEGCGCDGTNEDVSSKDAGRIGAAISNRKDLPASEKNVARRSLQRKVARAQRREKAFNVNADSGSRYRVGTKRPADPNNPKHNELVRSRAVSRSIDKDRKAGYNTEAVKPAMRMGVDFKYKAPSDAEKAAMNREKERLDKMRSTPDTSAAGRAAQKMIDARKKTEESYDKLTPAQERDAERRLKPTRATVSKVRLRAGEKDVAKSVKAYQADKGGKPGNTKQRKLRDLMLKGRTTNTEEVEVTESEVNKKDLRFRRTKVGDVDERRRRERERESQAHERDKARSTTEELLSVAEDMVTEAKDSYEVVAVKGKKIVAKMPAEKMDIKDAVAALTKMHGGADVQVHKNGKIVKMKG